MRIATCIKHAVDEAELKIDPSGRLTLESAVSKMSTFDKNALEEALRIRSAHGGDVVVLAVGTLDARKTLKEALAMGADRGILVVVPDLWNTDALLTAELLAAVISKQGPFDLILLSEGSSDVYTGEVPSMLAELLGRPYIGYARKVDLAGGKVRAERSLEDSVEAVEAGLPTVVSVVSEINEPRYPTLIQIMQASKKPIEEVQEKDLVATPGNSRVSVAAMSAQATSRRRIIVEGSPQEAAAKVVEELEKEGLISH